MGNVSGREQSMAESPRQVAGTDISIINNLPDDVLTEIFLRVPGKDLAKSCTLVCKRWHSVIDELGIWLNKCVHDGHFSHDLLPFLVDEDYKKLYFKHLYGRNLIKNHDASQEFSHWNIISQGGDGWKHEPTPVGSDPLENFLPEKQIAGKPISCWSSSYFWCTKEQVIDLMEIGCSAHVLDKIRPDIHVSDWYAARFDCGIDYHICVTLLKNYNKDAANDEDDDDEDGYDDYDDDDVEDDYKRRKDEDSELDKWSFSDQKPAGRAWFLASHTFSNYPAGVRYIRFVHKGKDTQFWAGNYGAKMSMSSVVLDLSHTQVDS